MKEVDLDKIYSDFFGKKDLDTKIEEVKDNNGVIINLDNIKEEVDSLYLDDDSKDMLLKIVTYMKLYKEKVESAYINFNILINGDNREVCDKVINILKDAASQYDYLEKADPVYLSLYKLSQPEEIKKSYDSSNFVIISDLKELNAHDENYKKKFLFNFTEHLLNNNLTIVYGNDVEIKEFLINDDLLSNKYFTFKINIVDPEVNEVCDDVISKISNFNIDDKNKIALLDYIASTINKRDTDYLTYRDNLCRDISFNKKLPTVEVSKTIEEIFEELNELVGLEKVKKVLYDLVDLIKLKSKTDELKINDVNLHMVFLGNPGTGKTTVARIICGILYDLKYIKQNKLIEVSSKDLVAEYVGQTAPKTMSVVEKALGGVLFVDEAYALADKGDNSFNAEAIATLIKAMEDYRDNLVVIFAGYTKEMQDFLNSNSGITSRIGYTLEFDDYTNEELKQIFNNMMTKSGFIVEDAALKKLDKLIDENRTDQNFGNARFVRNVYEKTVIRHASNTKNVKKKDILKKITEKDIDV